MAGKLTPYSSKPDKWGWGYYPETDALREESRDGTYMECLATQHIVSNNRAFVGRLTDPSWSVDATLAIWQAIKEFCFPMLDDYSFIRNETGEHLIEHHRLQDGQENPSIFLALRIMAPTDRDLDGPWKHGLRILNRNIRKTCDVPEGGCVFVGLAIGEFVRFYKWNSSEEQCVPLIDGNPRLNVEYQCQKITNWLEHIRMNFE